MVLFEDGRKPSLNYQPDDDIVPDPDTIAGAIADPNSEFTQQEEFSTLYPSLWFIGQNAEM